jgi:predicted porin
VITSYSELHYQQIEVNLGGTYQFTPALYVAADFGYQIFDDKSPYVYGDQDGEAYRASLGLGYRF